jgi:hypothetical protein
MTESQLHKLYRHWEETDSIKVVQLDPITGDELTSFATNFMRKLFLGVFHLAYDSLEHAAWWYAQAFIEEPSLLDSEADGAVNDLECLVENMTPPSTLKEIMKTASPEKGILRALQYSVTRNKEIAMEWYDCMIERIENALFSENQTAYMSDSDER